MCRRRKVAEVAEVANIGRYSIEHLEDEVLPGIDTRHVDGIAIAVLTETLIVGA